MVTLTIDGRETSVAEGTTILEAARGLGIRIPTLCHVEGFPPSASCFLCAVQIDGRATLAPSCAMPAADGMVVHTDSDDVRASRKMALELLLSDHVGDCIGPCRTGCPARLDIPGFISLMTAGDYRRAAEVVADDLDAARLARPHLSRASASSGAGAAMPASRCRSPACTGSSPIATSPPDAPYVPRREPASGKRVAIVGAGPAGLTAALNLLRRGHGVVIFDAHPEPGGMLRYGIPEFRLPRRVLDTGDRGHPGAGRRVPHAAAARARRHARRPAPGVRCGVPRHRRAGESQGLGCPGEELARPVDRFPRERRRGRPPALGRDVVVVGGGNSAIDAARTAIRLGRERRCACSTGARGARCRA